LILGSMTTLGVLAAPPITYAAPAKLTSKFVSLKEADCTVVEKPKPDDDFLDWSVSRCGKPVGGWTVYVDYGDVREDILLQRNGVQTALELTRLHGQFSSVGPALEFRLRNGVPFAAVVRHIVAVSEDPPTDTSYLMVARLRPKPCVVAEFPAAPNQSSLARIAADKADTLRCLLP
jgi:hypothetical protein